MLLCSLGSSFGVQAQVDWSDSAEVILPEPRLARINFTGINHFPSTLTSVGKAWMEFDDGAGNTLRQRVILKIHGQYTLSYPKRNLTLELCADEWVGDSTFQMQFGDWVKQDAFHLKAYYTDYFRGVGTVAYRLYEQLIATRGDSARYWQRMGIDDHDKALCHPDGFPCQVFLNGKFQGIYAWQLKKDRKNMNMRKDSAQHIHLDGILSDATLFNTKSIRWDQFEIRNPKKLYTMSGAVYDDDAPSELIDETSNSFDLETDTEKMRIAKRRTAFVKHSIMALSHYHADLTAYEDAGASAQQLRDSIARCYDIPGLIDYVCFSYFLGNSDGFRKNWQWFTYDGCQWSVAPYDLDGILGHSGDVLVPASMSALSTDYRMFGINIGGPTYWLCRYYWEDICRRYEELRDACIFTPNNLLALLEDWQQRVGEDLYQLERNTWPQSPCYRELLVNEGWSADAEWEGYSTVSDYDVKRTYLPGDRCRQSERLWTALDTLSAVAPCLQSGAPDSLPRVARWLQNHELLFDAYLGYHGQDYQQTIVIDSSGWTTLNTMLSCAIPYGLALYEVTSASSPQTTSEGKVSQLQLKRVTHISPYCTYLVHGVPGTYTLAGSCVPIDWKTQSNYLVTGLLTGLDEWSYVPKGKYVLQTRRGITAFYPVTEAQHVSVQAWQAYLNAPAGNTPQRFQFSPEVCDVVPMAEIDSTWLHELPVIELSYDSTAFKSSHFIAGRLAYHDADTMRYFDCKVRQRGGTSLKLDKPNFALKFVDSQGESRDVRFLGMRKDNNWILDAMASDHSRMRNRVSADLWLDFSRPPYHQTAEPKAINGYRGRYVEVYANGDYMGLFCLTERVDRKQLKIKKFEVDEADSTLHYRGLMYKAVSGNTVRTPFFYWQKNVPNNESWFYDGMQCEYPDVSEGEPWNWLPLRSNIYFLAAKSGNTFMTGVPLRFDVPVFIDYVLFIDLLYAPDNVGKNFFTWFYDQSSTDQRLGYTPWDLDTSWGRNYLGGRVSATSVLNNKSNFNTRMEAEWAGYADTLAIRYAGLRDSLWSEEALLQRFDDYFDLFERTGVWEREYDRWTGYKVNVYDRVTEQAYIHEWIHNRLQYLDGVYGYEPSQSIRELRSDRHSPASPSYDLFGRPTYSTQGLFITADGQLIFTPH